MYILTSYVENRVYNVYDSKDGVTQGITKGQLLSFLKRGIRIQYAELMHNGELKTESRMLQKHGDRYSLLKRPEITGNNMIIVGYKYIQMFDRASEKEILLIKRPNKYPDLKTDYNFCMLSPLKLGVTIFYGEYSTGIVEACEIDIRSGKIQWNRRA